jgi:hypothetical protein
MATRKFSSPVRRKFRPIVEILEDRSVPSSTGWLGFASDPQHTAQSSVASLDLDNIRWQTPVDLAPPFNGNGELLIHYATPMITPQNTVVTPVKTDSAGDFRMEGLSSFDGSVIWTATSDWIAPSSAWYPVFGATLTPQGRVYFAGAGGSIWYRDNADSPSGTLTRIAFYGTYDGSLNSTVFVDSPLTSDANGDIYFGFRVQGTAGAPLNTTQSGWARIAPDGSATSVFARDVTGDPNIGRDAMQDAPVLSNDGQSIYVVAKGVSDDSYAYLLQLNSTDLSLAHKVFLVDPRNNSQNARSIDISTASGTVAPDGTVFFGVMANPGNGSRGFMLHFSADLSTEYAPGAFGWDNTYGIVPASMVPGYAGPSSYLVFAKYNNYAGGFPAGDGTNQIAVLDPYATQNDERNDSDPTLQIMKEVMTKLGPTPDPDFVNAGFPNAVREWCIDSAVVDPATDSILTPSEDGHLYRWFLGSGANGTLTQSIALTGGIGEAYVPTAVGPDGTIYTLNGAMLFAIGNASQTSVASSPNASVFGQTVTFTATVSPVPATAGTPTGTVQFVVDGSNFGSPIPLSSGFASVTTSVLSVGTHTVSAIYSGSSAFAASSGSLAGGQTVNQDGTATALVSSPNPSVFSQTMTFTATVSPAAPGSGVATGTITFTDGATTLGTVSLSGGVASLTTSVLAVGNHAISASYSGDGNFTASGSNVVNQTVNQDGTTTVLTSSPNPSAHGQAVTFTAAVMANSPGSGIPTGTVTFKANKTLGTFALDGTGHATLTLSNLTPGSTTMTAVYNGSTSFLTSIGSTVQSVTGGKKSTTTSLVSSLNPSHSGEVVTFTATVTPVPAGSGPPTGTVTFFDGSATLGTGSLSGGSAAFTTSGLTVGNHPIVARYNGDANFNASKSSTLTQTVTAAATATELVSRLAPGQVINPVFPALTRIVVTLPITSSVGTQPSVLDSLSSHSVASVTQELALTQGARIRNSDAELTSQATPNVDRAIVDQIFSVL